MEIQNHEQLCQTNWTIWAQAQRDPEYAQLRLEMEELEPLYESILTSLSRELREVIHDYVTYRETMSRRMLELACQQLGHPCPE